MKKRTTPKNKRIKTSQNPSGNESQPCVISSINMLKRACIFIAKRVVPNPVTKFVLNPYIARVVATICNGVAVNNDLTKKMANPAVVPALTRLVKRYKKFSKNANPIADINANFNHSSFGIKKIRTAISKIETLKISSTDAQIRKVELPIFSDSPLSKLKTKFSIQYIPIPRAIIPKKTNRCFFISSFNH